jgi:hypothetical protein
MKTVREILGKGKKVKGDVGIEIEAEGENMHAVDTAVWKTEADGSLRPRNGFPDKCAEFVLQEPIPVTMVKPALNQLKDELKEATFAFSSRCSVHVHINVLNLEYQQLLAMIYAYYLLEEPFMTFCGKKRKGNNFCLRLQDAEGQLEAAMNLVKYGEQGIQMLQADQSRYSALNLEALKKYGSVEFRGMEGNLDVNRIDIWCNALVCLRNFAIDAGDIEGVKAKYAELGGRKFLSAVLGGGAEHFVYRNVGQDIDYGFSISFDYTILWDRVKQAKVEAPAYTDHELGEMLTVDQARKFIDRGGNVKAMWEKIEDGIHEMYQVIRESKRPKQEINLFGAQV